MVIIRFLRYFGNFLDFEGYFGHFWVPRVFWSFCRFWGYFGPFCFVFGVFWSFFMFKGYFGNFSGFGVF